MNEMLWLDGTQDSKEIPGIRSFILNDEDAGTTGGISRGVNTWWRNRQLTGASKITHSTSNQTLTKTLRAEVRQLRRYGGKPSMVLCGSDALERIEAEIHEKGVYTQEGFAKNIDLASPGITMRGVGKFMYDPTLDDLGLEEYIFMIDPSKLHLMVMDGEDRKQHTPARPYDRYVMYRAMTYTGGMIAKQLNCHGVYETA
jgi:hypothetical protein